MRERASLELELRDLGLPGLQGVEREFELEASPGDLGRLWRSSKTQGQGALGTTVCDRVVMAHFFPGTSEERALVIAGVHGSELSGIEVVERLRDGLRTGPPPHFSVVIVPRLFPDNAAVAESQPREIGSTRNVGRYTKGSLVDPNRQFPLPGRAFDPANPVDAGPELPCNRRGPARPIERENIWLLELIDGFRPTRIANVHSVRKPNIAGIFADPRSRADGTALDFDDDKRLPLAMARHAASRGAKVPANKLATRSPNALYPRDPPIVKAGEIQTRNTDEGVSLGGWGSTEVGDPARSARIRSAMIIITIEVQTALRIADEVARVKGAEAKKKRRAARTKEIEAHVSALREVFLGPPLPAKP